MKNIKTLVLAAITVAFLSAPAQAAYLNGSFSATGFFYPVTLGGELSTIPNSEAIDFVLEPGQLGPTPGTPGQFVVGSALGDFAHLNEAVGTIQDVSIGAMGNANYPMPPILGFQVVGDVSFDLEAVTVLRKDDEFMDVRFTGLFNRDGFWQTGGVMNFSANTVLGSSTFSWSASEATSSVPEPASMLLMGATLLGFAAMVRRRRL